MKIKTNPFTLVRESKCRQKRSRKYRKLNMGYSVPSTITTSTATLSAYTPTSLPAPTHSLAHQAHPTHYPHPGHKCTGHHTKQGWFGAPHQHWSHHQYIHAGPQMRSGILLNKRKKRGLVKPYEYRTGRLQRRIVGGRQRKNPLMCTWLACW